MMIKLMLLVPALLYAAPSVAADPAPAPTVTASPFVVGRTTLAQVLAERGRPQFQTSLSDGTRVVVYTRSSAHVKGASLIPIIGMFAGGVTAQSTVDSYTFDAQDLLKSFTVSSSDMNCSNRGLGASCR
jgi:uncharacterized protein (DUF697 family)